MTWNPFNWTAEPFLALYVTLAVIVFLLGFGLRSMMGPAAHATRRLTCWNWPFSAVAHAGSAMRHCCA